MERHNKGSQWRRWDLHVHTPDTALEDRYQGEWEGFLQAIEAQSAVRVVGITDYLSIDNYSKVRCHKLEGRLPNVDLLIPNIEFRMGPETSSGQAVNIHVLTSPDAPDHEARIRRALEDLNFQFTNGESYRCTHAELTKLGRAYSAPNYLDDKTAYCEGVKQFKVEFMKFKHWFESQTWLHDNSLIFVAGGKDGVGGLRHGGGWGAVRLQIQKFSHGFFSSNPGDREFWLNEREGDNTFSECKGPKPCIHGSDAHSLSELFEPTLNRYCWIKSDPTFQGLRQILYEPEDRVFIGKTPPGKHVNAKVIDSIKITPAGYDPWFEPVTIPLGTGLVSIIGKRGSGKSALAELITFAAGSWVKENRSTFIERADKHIAGLEVELVWRNGDHLPAMIGQAAQSKPRLRYLSQHFVEKLCSVDHTGVELVHEIERVIFAHTPVEDRLGAASFDQLREKRAGSLRQERSRQKSEIVRLIDELVRLRQRQTTLLAKKADITKAEEDGNNLKVQINSLATGDETSFVEQFAEYQKKVLDLEQRVANFREKLLICDRINNRLSQFQIEADTFLKEFIPLLRDVGIPASSYESFRPRLAEDVWNLIQAARTQLEEQHVAVHGKVVEQAGTLLYARKQLEELNNKATQNAAIREQLQNLQTQLTKLEATINQQKEELILIEVTEANYINEIEKKLEDCYLEAFESLFREEEILEDLYRPVHEHIASQGESTHPLEFSIRRRANLELWLTGYEGRVDSRKTLPLTIEGLRTFAVDTLQPAWLSGDKQQVAAALRNLLSKLRIASSQGLDYLKRSMPVTEFLKWAYDFDHITLEYGLKYNDTDLENLSPGTKGIVLLILYLIMDKDDKSPLIIDQPEENLDNESVYDLLVPHFRKAKLDRQIILVSHNPNLVVNTDSEQVIYADCERIDKHPYFRYQSGSLEDDRPDGTRDRICCTLEGGKIAFLRREKRYELGEDRKLPVAT